MMNRIIGKDSGLLLDLAAYSIITENNAGQYYPDYGYNHPLFTDSMKIYSDSKVSDFLTRMTQDQSIGFLNEWNTNRDHREKIYISYDSTNKAAWTMGENGAPLIDEAKVSIECEVDGNYELESFDNFICKILAAYADEAVLNEQGKIDYNTFKPVLFEFPTYEYFVTGEKVGNCGKMN